MKIRTALALTAALVLLCIGSTAWAQRAVFSQSVQNDTSPPLSELLQAQRPPAQSARGTPQWVIPIGERENLNRDPSDATPDTGINVPQWFMAPTPPPMLSVPGLSEDDNVATVGGAIVPPDTNGDIGFDGAGNKIYFQYINLVWGIFDGVTGALTAGPFPGNSFWAGFSGPCEDNNDGDPVVLYDDHANRWMVSQFSIDEGIQCTAVSATSDPLGPWHRYAFLVSPGKLNDYPKLGVWDDGTTGSTGQSAYTFTTRDFPVQAAGFNAAGVMERDAMLVGAPAQFIKFPQPCVTDECVEGLLPPHMDGPQAPPQTCPTFWAASDADYDDTPHANDGYRNYTLCVDWGQLGDTTFVENPQVDAGSNFDRFLGNGFSECIAPVQGGEALDCLAAFTMFRAQYRWFGDHARVVFNTTVDAGGDRGGIRWTEIESADGQSGWTLRQDGTYAPDDGQERWMGSIAQDQDGNIALGFSVTSGTRFPSVAYVGRSAGDPPGTLPGGEITCHEGTGAQVASFNRWGDYSSMSVDPEDDCTFWYTQEYYETTGSFDFNTRICSFKFEDCGAICEPDEPGEELTCNDGIDNDCDGNVDCFDDDCADAPECQCIPEPEICDNGIDDDCDGFVDCDDVDCELDPICLPPETPENDLCEDAIEIVCPAEGGEVTISGTTIAATIDTEAGTCGTASITSPGVWYKTTFAGFLTASTCNQADYDTKLSAYDGLCGELGCITGRDDSPGCGLTTEIDWFNPGVEHKILVHGFGGASGNFDLTLTCLPPAENDICEDAEGPLAVGSITPGSTRNAFPDEPPEIDCGTSVTAPGVWYTVTGTGNTMTASMCNDGNPATGGADYDSKISVYCADCAIKECIGGRDDTTGCANFSTAFSWPTEPGATYNVFVHGFFTATGDFDLAILDDGVPVPPGEANNCNGIAFDKFLVGGPDQNGDGVIDNTIEVGTQPATGYEFVINYVNLNPNPIGLRFRDIVPRAWNVEYLPISPIPCSVVRADERRNLFSDNYIDCYPNESGPTLFAAETRCDMVPGSADCQPLECGTFWLNEGSTVYQGRTSVEGPTDPICFAAVPDLGGGINYAGYGDTDGDGVGDFAEACDDFTNPCDPASVGDTTSCRDCLDARPTAGCANTTCMDAVCAVDPWCCEVNWDGICVGEALDICEGSICFVPPSGPTGSPMIEGGRLYESMMMSKDPAAPATKGEE